MDLHIDGTGTTVFDRISKKKVAVFADRGEARRYHKSAMLANCVKELILALAGHSKGEKLEVAIAAAATLEEAGVPIPAAVTEAINQLGSHEPGPAREPEVEDGGEPAGAGAGRRKRRS